MLLDIYQATGFLLFSVKNTTIILVQDLFWINFYFYYYYYFLDHCCRKSVDFFTPVFVQSHLVMLPITTKEFYF